MIELTGITKKVMIDGKRVNILSIDSLVFESGLTYLLKGRSGSGKTTLLNIISGLTLPTSGGIYVDGVKINALSEIERDKYRAKSVGYIFQDFNLIEEFNVYDNVVAALSLTGDKTNIAGRVNNLLASMNLNGRANTKVSKLSGGEKQRVALCRAIVKHPTVLLADEPTGNLDKANADRVIKEIIDKANADKATLITVSHDISYSGLFDKIINMEDICLDDGRAEA